MKVIVGIAVVAVLAALGTNWLRDKGSALVHNVVDTSLPKTVDGHVWTPIEHGRPMPSSRLRFSDGRVTAVRCHARVGSFAVSADHRFSFSPTGPIRKGCPGGLLRKHLARATRVDVTHHDGTVEMTLSDANHRAVARFTSPDR